MDSHRPVDISFLSTVISSLCGYNSRPSSILERPAHLPPTFLPSALRRLAVVRSFLFWTHLHDGCPTSLTPHSCSCSYRLVLGSVPVSSLPSESPSFALLLILRKYCPSVIDAYNFVTCLVHKIVDGLCFGAGYEYSFQMFNRSI